MQTRLVTLFGYELAEGHNDDILQVIRKINPICVLQKMRRKNGERKFTADPCNTPYALSRFESNLSAAIVHNKIQLVANVRTMRILYTHKNGEFVTKFDAEVFPNRFSSFLLDRILLSIVSIETNEHFLVAILE